jgi:hypothetical protein
MVSQPLRWFDDEKDHPPFLRLSKKFVVWQRGRVGGTSTFKRSSSQSTGDGLFCHRSRASFRHPQW